MKRSEALEMLTLARNFEQHLKSSKLGFSSELPVSVRIDKMPDRYQTSSVVVNGTLNLSFQEYTTKVDANCVFRIYHDWRKRQPQLVCRENWIINPGRDKLSDWHRYYDGSFCYIHHEQWRDLIAQRESDFSTEVAIFDAVFLAINNARWLLCHHLFAYKHNLTEWPKTWPEWAHGHNGTLEYRTMRDGGLISGY